VCRDYFNVLIAAADVAWNEAQTAEPPRTEFRIEAENIHAAAGELFDQKLGELRADAGLDAPAIEARLEDDSYTGSSPHDLTPGLGEALTLWSIWLTSRRW
jgi:hypothetical protein